MNILKWLEVVTESKIPKQSGTSIRENSFTDEKNNTIPSIGVALKDVFCQLAVRYLSVSPSLTNLCVLNVNILPSSPGRMLSVVSRGH